MQHFFRDSEGNVVIAQKPNAPIIVWALAFAIQLLPLPIAVLTAADAIGFGALFTWAWLELTDGVNMFRRFIGAVILVGMVILSVLRGSGIGVY